MVKAETVERGGMKRKEPRNNYSKKALLGD
jgi:hypothetical protein